MVLGEITSPWRGAGPPKSGMDKQGAWKADMEVVIQSHWRCLVEAIKWVDQEKQATPNIREIHDSSSIFKWYSLKQAKIKKKKQANHNKIVHLIINNSQFIWVKDGFHIGIHCLHQAIIIGFHDASWRTKLESNDYPLLQHSKVKLFDICIHTMLRT